MDNKKRKIFIFAPLILWAFFVAIALIVVFVFSKYYRAERFWGLYITLIVIACILLLASFTFSIIGVIKVPKNKKFVSIIEIGVNSLSIFCVGYYILILMVGYALGGNDYKRMQKACGTPQAFLSLGDGSHYHLNNKDYPVNSKNDLICDNDNIVFDIIYNASYKKVEKIGKNAKSLNYAQYTANNDRGVNKTFVIYESGEAYAYDPPGTLFYTGGTQYFIFDVKTAEEIIVATNAIISSYLAL